MILPSINSYTLVNINSDYNKDNLKNNKDLSIINNLLLFILNINYIIVNRRY